MNRPLTSHFFQDDGERKENSFCVVSFAAVINQKRVRLSGRSGVVINTLMLSYTHSRVGALIFWLQAYYNYWNNIQHNKHL